ncbi:MAG: tetratricopeptide repeat protein [Sphaerochaetaceae bacterium]|nr:tetratricopeptide repeat protein [Sphaerochaetaceae bacterium]
MTNTNEPKSAGKLESKFNAFLGAHKKLLVIIAAVIVVAVVALWIGLSVADKNADAAQLRIDNLQKTYMTWSTAEDKTSPDATQAKSDLMAGLQELSGKGGVSYPVLKATYLLGLVAYEEGAYADALAHFMVVGDRGKDSYLGSLALYNAGVTSEQLGDMAKALEQYQAVYDRYGADAAESPKALFSVGRLHEANGNGDLAKAVFQQLADEFAASEYAKLARSRLIALQ